MSLEPPPPQQSGGEIDFAKGILRRKRIDLAFALLGLFLVTASLTVLLALFGQLVSDGHARLAGGHLVLENGYAPGIRDVVGVLKEGQGSICELHQSPCEIVNASSILPVHQLKELGGSMIAVSAELPAPGQYVVEAAAIRTAKAEDLDRFSRDELYGELVAVEGKWTVVPRPLPIDCSGLTGPYTDLFRREVAVTFGLSKRLPLKAKAIEPLVFQSFFGSMPSREPERAGIKSALVGSVLVVLLTMCLAVPFGIAAGIWLEEYAAKNWLSAVIEVNIANLAGVPSIVWGLMSLGLLVYQFGLGRSILTAGITLGLLVLPIVIMATRESIRAIPNHLREASYACGAGKWETVRHHILPYATGGILTGSIIGLSRAIGETAPLITIGGLTYIAHLPEFSWSNPLGWVRSGFTVLPIQMFNWISRPDVAFHQNAAAAGVVLLILTLSLNAIAIVLRYRLRRLVKW